MPASRGKFIWYDVMTTDTKAAAKFYCDVIGWSAQEHPMVDRGTYTVFSKGAVMVAGLMAIPDPVRAEVGGAADDRTRLGGVWRLKSREFGRIAFKRLKIFNAFKEPLTKLY